MPLHFPIDGKSPIRGVYAPENGGENQGPVHMGNAVHVVRMHCKVLCVSNYPSLVSALWRIFCYSIIVHTGYDIFE